MILKSFSKINLTLTVSQKLKLSKMHDIQSYFCLINLFDKIRVKKIKGSKDIIKFKGKFAKSIKKKDNSVANVLKILRNQNIISNYYSVVIQKYVPVFSGMGGGTSNAFFLAKYLTKNKINKKLLNIFDKKIGSDFKLFFYKQGFLKSLQSIKSFSTKHRLFFLIIYPNVKCSTQYIYSRVKKFSLKDKYNFIRIKDTDKFIEFLVDKNNDLQSIVEKQHPIIKELIKEIKQKKGCHYSRMTGSGSACYGVFQSERLAITALNRLRIKYPKIWLSVAKTI